MRHAFAQYYRAYSDQTVQEKQQATYLGNCFAVWHEHVRLEPYIQGAMPWIIRRCVTERLLQFDIGSLKLAVAHDVPAPAQFTEWGTDPLPPEQDDRALLRLGSETISSGGASATCTAARDWTRIAERMRYIFALFRAFHLEPQVLAMPYEAAQPLPLRLGSGQWVLSSVV